MLQDRVAAAESRLDADERSGPAFWAQIDGLVSRHESQMRTLAQMAGSLRSGLSAARRAASSSHARRLEEARTTLEALRGQIRRAKAELESDRSAALRAEEQRLRAQLPGLSSEAAALVDSVAVLHETSSRMRAKAQVRKVECDAKAQSVRERARTAGARAERLAADIDAANRECRELEEELEDLAHREAACVELYDSLRQPLPLVRRIPPPV
jgi:chromosome segregation ATPase